jgi:hypothetical protein
MKISLKFVGSYPMLEALLKPLFMCFDMEFSLFPLA